MLRILGGLFLGLIMTSCGPYMPSNTSRGDMGSAISDMDISDQAEYVGPDMVTTLAVPAGCNTTTVVSGTQAYKTLSNATAGGMRCMGGNCHNNNIKPLFNSQATFMSLTINKLSTASMNYVTPNIPDKSYILYKLTGNQAMVRNGGGVQMPRMGTPLTSAEVCVIYDWILHGAPTN